ncbi:zinc finger protein 271-like isoform X2 [Neocloeon triangulifer]|uniref:zinc finger protein 271-like isoform X2 n=1 Tax=Neocloeon triangulifer TaxID=2078957 RepID=UPI00286F31A0|nr:zinc finger protein 271-like isoform X2 [Neocloeon triangulifer]
MESIYVEIDSSEDGDCSKLIERCSGADFNSYLEPSVEVHINEEDEIQDDTAMPIFEVSMNNDLDVINVNDLEEITEDKLCFKLPYSGFPSLCEADVKSIDLCRICGSPKNAKLAIFSEEGRKRNLCEKIHKHLPIRVMESDRLPLQICLVCVTYLEMCHQLVKCCGETEQRLKELVSKEELEESNQKIIETGLECLNTPESVTAVTCMSQEEHKLPSGLDFANLKSKVAEKSTIKVVVVRLHGSDDKTNDNSIPENGSSLLADSHELFLCTVCNENIQGVESVVKHQRDVHSIEMNFCQWCKELFDSQQVLESHQLEKHLGEWLKVTNVAEIQLLREGSMKMSKEFNQMEKSLQSKIVDAIQAMVGQQNLKETGTATCRLCRQTFSSLALLQEHHAKAHEDPKGFTCHYCQSNFYTKRMLLRHITEHSEYKGFRCTECLRAFNTKTGYNIHMRTHSEEKPYMCPECGKTFKHSSNLRAHEKSHLPDDQKKRFKCPHCEKTYRCQFLVDEHSRTHTGERPFSCDVCSKSFHRKQQLSQHLLVHRTDLTFECHLCGSRFNRKGNLNEHMKKHIYKNKYVCKICKETFDTISEVVAHRKGHTNEELAQDKSESTVRQTEARFECEFCKKFLATKTSLAAHVRIHTGEKPFECDTCGKKFSQKPALTYHRKKHSVEKPHRCTYCSEGFITRTARIVHERIHTNEKPYSCQYCGASFRGSGSLNQHLSVHSDDKRFKCSHCTSSFHRKESLQIHERIHTGLKPYVCDLCERAFKQRGDLTKHKKTHSKTIRQHICRMCDFVCTNRKTMKKHEATHSVEDVAMVAGTLITTFPEITIEDGHCEIMLDEGVIEVEQIQLQS